MGGKSVPGCRCSAEAQGEPGRGRSPARGCHSPSSLSPQGHLAKGTEGLYTGMSPAPRWGGREKGLHSRAGHTVSAVLRTWLGPQRLWGDTSHQCHGQWQARVGLSAAGRREELSVGLWGRWGPRSARLLKHSTTGRGLDVHFWGWISRSRCRTVRFWGGGGPHWLAEATSLLCPPTVTEL